jgi:hypothetical protein
LTNLALQNFNNQLVLPNKDSSIIEVVDIKKKLENNKNSSLDAYYDGRDLVSG